MLRHALVSCWRIPARVRPGSRRVPRYRQHSRAFARNALPGDDAGLSSWVAKPPNQQVRASIAGKIRRPDPRDAERAVSIALPYVDRILIKKNPDVSCTSHTWRYASARQGIHGNDCFRALCPRPSEPDTPARQRRAVGYRHSYYQYGFTGTVRTGHRAF